MWTPLEKRSAGVKSAERPACVISSECQNVSRRCALPASCGPRSLGVPILTRNEARKPRFANHHTIGIADTHEPPKGMAANCVWKLFTIKTLLERAGLRTGVPSMGAFLFGAWVSGTLRVNDRAAAPIVRGSRRLVYGLLSWNRWNGVFLEAGGAAARLLAILTGPIGPGSGRPGPCRSSDRGRGVSRGAGRARGGLPVMRPRPGEAPCSHRPRTMRNRILRHA